MMSKLEPLKVTLVGGGPWGFRLQGGRDHATPLIVSKIRKKSKAFNNLVEGDIVIGINGKSCQDLTLDDVMALVDNASGDLTLEIVRGADPKQNEEKENVAPKEALSNVSEGEKQKDVVVVLQNQQTVSDTESTPALVEDQQQVSFTIPIKKLPSPFQQAPVAQVTLSQPAVIEQVSVDSQVTIQQVSVSHKSESLQQVSQQQEVPQTETEHNISVEEAPTPQALPVQEVPTSLSEKQDLLVSHTPIPLLSQETVDKTQINQQDQSKSLNSSTKQNLHTVETQKITESESQSVQLVLDSPSQSSPQIELVKETISVSEISSVQQAPLISQQTPVQHAPTTEVLTTHPIVSSISTDKEPGAVSASISPQDISSSVDQSSVTVVPVEKKKVRLIASSSIVSESQTLTPSVSAGQSISVTQTQSGQDILSEAEQIISAEQENLKKLAESNQSTVETSTCIVIKSKKEVKEVISLQPPAKQPALPSTIQQQEESSKINSLIQQTDSEIKVSAQVPLVTSTSEEIKTDSVSIKQEVSLPAVHNVSIEAKPKITLPQACKKQVEAQPLVEKSPSPLKQPLIANFSVETSVNQSVETKVTEQASTVVITQSEKKVPLSQEQGSLPQVQAPLPQAQVPIQQAQVPIPQAQVTISQAQVQIQQAQVPIQQAQVSVSQAQVILPKAQVTLPQVQSAPPAQKLISQQPLLHQAPPLQRSSSPFQQVPIQQVPSPQQALLTDMGQGESKKESQLPPSLPSVESQQPLRPLPQLENIPPPPAHLLEPCFEPPPKVIDLPPQEKKTSTPEHFISTTTSPQTYKSPELQPQKPITSPSSLPPHIQDNIPEIPKHLLESNDSQPVLHAKSLKEIHEREIQRVAQEKTAYDSTSRMLQEFEELRSMQMRGEISEPTAFGMRKPIDNSSFSQSLVNGHVSSGLNRTQNVPINEIEEFISPDNSTKRWITRGKISDGGRTEERFTDSLHHQKDNVKITQTTSRYQMSDIYQLPSQTTTSPSKSVIWPPPPPSSPTLQRPGIWQPSATTTTPIIQDFTWQPLITSSTEASPSVWKPYETSSQVSESLQKITTVSTGDMDDPVNILQEPHESVAALKKRFENQEYKDNEKLYTSSSFYADANELYPTMEEQIQSAKKIADSLYDDANKKSRGATMFDKRKEEEFAEFRNRQRDGGTSPLKLFMDPRSTVRNTQDTVYHNIVSPDVCHDLVKDLNSPKGKGASMFAKRRLKSEDWIVEDKNIPSTPQMSRPPVAPSTFQRTPQSTTPRTQPPAQRTTQQPTPDKIISDLIQTQRIKLIKSPWEAALESPIGSCEGAFEEYGTKPIGKAGNIVDTIRGAAENRELPGPPESWKTTSTSFSYAPPPITPAVPRPLPKFSGESSLLSQQDTHSYKTKFDAKSSQRPFSPTSDAPNYNRAARGWTPVRTFESQETSHTSGFQSPLPTATTETVRPTVFGDYNLKPRKWVPPGTESQGSYAAEAMGERALSPGRQSSNYNSLPRSFGSSTKTSPGKLPSNVWPYESRDEYSSEFKSYQAPRSRQQFSYGEEVGYTDL